MKSTVENGKSYVSLDSFLKLVGENEGRLLALALCITGTYDVAGNKEMVSVDKLSQLLNGQFPQGASKVDRTQYALILAKFVKFGFKGVFGLKSQTLTDGILLIIILRRGQ